MAPALHPNRLTLRVPGHPVEGDDAGPPGRHADRTYELAGGPVPGKTVTRTAAAELIVCESVGDVVPMVRVDGRGPRGTPTRM